MARQIPFGQPAHCPAIGVRCLMIEDIHFLSRDFVCPFRQEFLQTRTLAQLERIWAFAIGRHGLKPSDFPYMV